MRAHPRALALGLVVGLGAPLATAPPALGGPPLAEVEARAATAADLLPAAASLARLGPARYDALRQAGLRSTARTRAAALALGDGAAAVARRLSLEAGRGLALADAPLVRYEVERARQRGGAGAPRTGAEHVAAKLQLFALAARLDGAPAGLRPVYAESVREAAAGGDIEVVAARTFAAGTLLAIELAGDGLDVDADGRVRLDDDTPAARRRAFDALCHLYAASVRLDALARGLATDGKTVGAVDLDGYAPYQDPRWIPERLAVEARADGPPALRLLDARSGLDAHALALLAAARFVELLGPGGRLAPLVDGVRIGDRREEVIAKASVEDVRRIGRFLYRNLAALHFDPAPDNRRFAAFARQGIPDPGIGVGQIGLALQALSRARGLLQGDAVLSEEARRMLEVALGAVVRDLPPSRGGDGLPAGLGGVYAAGELAAATAGPSAVASLLGGLLAAQGGALGTGGPRALLERAALDLEERGFHPEGAIYARPGAWLGPEEAASALGCLADLGERLGRPEALLRLEDAAEGFARLRVLPDRERGEARVVRLDVAAAATAPPGAPPDAPPRDAPPAPPPGAPPAGDGR